MLKGKSVRLRRIFGADGNTIITPMDHGLSLGPEGLEDIHAMIKKVKQGGADAIVVHRGIARDVKENIGMFIHLSGSTPYSPEPDDKVLVCSVKSALALNADAISLQLNVGAEGEAQILEDFGRVADECLELGVPLMAMAYPKGEKAQAEDKKESILKVARVADELGADVIKIPYTGDTKSFERVVNACGAPIVIAGGAKSNNPADVLKMVEESIHAGGRGICLGRNVFQAPDPVKMTKALAGIIHEKKSAKEAMGEIQ